MNIKRIIAGILSLTIMSGGMHMPDNTQNYYGNSSVTHVSAAELPYVNWRQGDSRWKSILLVENKSDSSVGRIGCVATSLCCLLVESGVCSEDETVFNPKIGITAMKKAGGFDTNANIYWSPAASANSKDFKFEKMVTLSGSQDQRLAAIKKYYEQGYYMQVKVVCGSQHWVAVRRFIGDKCEIMDTGGTNQTYLSGYKINDKVVLYKAPKPAGWRYQDISSVSIAAPASKTTYWPYEAVQTNGLSLKVTYSNGTTKTISSGFKVSADMSKAGTVPVTVSYTENSVTKTVKYNITVKHPFSGTGTESDPYLIQNSDDLVRLAKVINGPYVMTSDGKKLGYNFLYYKQTEDIDLAGINFTPIGVYYKDYSNTDITDNITSDNVFSGVYDGNNHTVSNLSIKDYSHCYCGLFGRITTGTVKNLAVTGEVISSNVCTGGIVGETGYNSTVTGCSFSGKVEGAGSTGGLVGCFFTGGKISDCYVNADVKDISDIKTRACGGITGRISVGTRENAQSVDAVLENCYFTGTVEGNNLTGTAAGIRDIGTVQTGKTITVKNVYTDSDIKSTDDTGVTFVKTEELKSLNGMSSLSFVKSSKSQNSGYPVFAWQKTESEDDDTPEITAGDINNDGIIDMTDLSNLSLWLLGDMELNDGQLIAADATGDGNVDIADLSHFKMYISKGIGWIGMRK